MGTLPYGHFTLRVFINLEAKKRPNGRWGDCECRATESNCGPCDFQSHALPTELARLLPDLWRDFNNKP